MSKLGTGPGKFSRWRLVFQDGSVAFGQGKTAYEAWLDSKTEKAFSELDRAEVIE